jgi:prephenate dehydrogenase
LELGLVDEIMDLDEAIDNSDIVILAIPVDALVKTMPHVLDKINNQVLIDMGSTKSELMSIANDHAKRGRYVATHPMWGTEYSGPQAAVHGAFENTAVIICNANESDEDALEWTKNM